MSKKKQKMRSYIVRVIEKVEREYVVDAVDKDDARENYGRDAKRPGDVLELECMDWDVTRVEENV